jgi:hypothetical protein
MIQDSHREFLLGPARAGKVRHSGRDLYAHLCGTHDLLEAWGNSEPVCAAGLFHSIYGTVHFRHKSWPLAGRAIIQKLIGPEAEQLAYAFCMADRPKAFFANADGFLTRPLREIEAANLVEQGSRSPWLTRLYDSDISAPAKHAIDRHLGAMV